MPSQLVRFIGESVLHSRQMMCCAVGRFSLVKVCHTVDRCCADTVQFVSSYAELSTKIVLSKM